MTSVGLFGSMFSTHCSRIIRSSISSPSCRRVAQSATSYCASSSRPEAASDPGHCDAPPGASGECGDATEALQAQLSSLQQELDSLKDKYTRSLAERENLRMRMEKQVENAKVFSIQSFSKDLLNVEDILEKATESVPPDQIGDSNPHLKNLFEGLKMTQAQLLSVFRSHGLEQVEAMGAKFDPNLHEALFEQKVPDCEPGHVFAVTQVGYTLHGRVIRPAKVGLAKA